MRALGCWAASPARSRVCLEQDLVWRRVWSTQPYLQVCREMGRGTRGCWGSPPSHVCCSCARSASQPVGNIISNNNNNNINNTGTSGSVFPPICHLAGSRDPGDIAISIPASNLAPAQLLQCLRDRRFQGRVPSSWLGLGWPPQVSLLPLLTAEPSKRAKVWVLPLSDASQEGFLILPWLLSIPPWEKVAQLQCCVVSDGKQKGAVWKSKQKWLQDTFCTIESVFD